ncbi:MAG: hypothetical protein H6Q64_1896 [Firmicutes bacterium]|nr:hypothetical protein [Bacillota bacterium]
MIQDDYIKELYHQSKRMPIKSVLTLLCSRHIIANQYNLIRKPPDKCLNQHRIPEVFIVEWGIRTNLAHNSADAVQGS